MDISGTTIGKHEAAPDRHHGRIVRVAKELLVLTSDVSGDKQYVVAPDVKVTRRGKPRTIDDLKSGEVVFVTVRKDDAARALEIEGVDGD